MFRIIEVPATLLAVYGLAFFGVGLVVGGLTVLHVAKQWMQETNDRIRKVTRDRR